MVNLGGLTGWEPLGGHRHFVLGIQAFGLDHQNRRVPTTDQRHRRGQVRPRLRIDDLDYTRSLPPQTGTGVSSSEVA